MSNMIPCSIQVPEENIFVLADLGDGNLKIVKRIEENGEDKWFSCVGNLIYCDVVSWIHLSMEEYKRCREM